MGRQSATLTNQFDLRKPDKYDRPPQFRLRDWGDDQGVARKMTASLEVLVDQWLNRCGLRFDPFRNLSSELDLRLDDYYFEHPDFAANFELHHSLIYARSGAGKTAARFRIASHHLNAFVSHKVLAVAYSVPHALAEQPPDSFAEHIQHLIRAVVQTAFVVLAQFGYALSGLKNHVAIRRLAWYFNHNYPSGLAWREDLLSAIKSQSLRDVLSNLAYRYDENMSPALPGTVNTSWLQTWHGLLTHQAPLGPDLSQANRETREQSKSKPDLRVWHDLRALLLELGISHIVVLVDGVDASPGLEGAERKMTHIARPFAEAIASQSLGADVSLKLFLPIEIEPLLARHLGATLPVFQLDWSREALRELISQRLSQASGDVIRSLNQLVDPEVVKTLNLEEYLISRSSFTPRLLLHAIEQLFQTHAQHSYEQHGEHFSKEGGSPKISRESIEAFTQEYKVTAGKATM
jgi:hypothetical protein